MTNYILNLGAQLIILFFQWQILLVTSKIRRKKIIAIMFPEIVINYYLNSKGLETQNQMFLTLWLNLSETMTKPNHFHIQGAPQKCMNTLSTDSSILKTKCILINTIFITIQCVYTFWGGITYSSRADGTVLKVAKNYLYLK